MSRPSNCRAAAFAPLVLLAIVWSAAAPAASTAQAIANMSLADFARYIEGREFYGVYLFGRKVGWVSDESRLTEHQGAPVLETMIEFHMEARVAGERTSTILREAVRYSLEGEGTIASIETVETDDDSQVQRSAVREAGMLRITSREKSGKTSERVVPLPRATLRNEHAVILWLARSPKKGARIKTWTTDLGEEQIDAEETLEFIESEPLVWGGVPVRASRVRIHLGGPNFTAVIAPDGKVMRGRLAGLLEFRAEKEEIAKALDQEPVDMMAASSIKVAKALGDRDTITGLTLELSGLGDFQLPASARQRVQRTGKGRATVELLRESPLPALAPLAPQERERLLRATPSVQSDDASILRLAREIAGNETNPATIAARIVLWMAANMEQDYGSNAATATAVLAQKSGDCTEHALLFTALARAAGLPTRQLGGIIYVEDPSPLFGWHAWAEIHDGQGWITVDPIWHQVRVDPTHVQFSSLDGELSLKDSAWIQAIGKLKIKVKQVERG